MSTKPTNEGDSISSPGMTQLEQFRSKGVPPPGALYVTLDDVFQLNVWIGDTAQEQQLTIRMLSPDGQLQRYQRTFSATPVAPASANQFTITGMEGFLLSVSVKSGSFNSNTCFCSVLLMRQPDSEGVTFGMLLCQGYISQYDSIGFPIMQAKRSVDGRGGPRVVTPATPAAGADWTQTITNGLLWTLRSVNALFTASAAVANRFPCLQVVDGANKILFTVPPVAAITANQIIQCCWYPGANATNVNNIQTMATPIEGRHGSNQKVRTVTTAIDVGDQWTNIRVVVEQWLGV